VQHAHLSK
jgi:hypothetical protein